MSPAPFADIPFFGRRRLLAELGAGGTARVYLATGSPLDAAELVAVKILGPTPSDELTPEWRAMFSSEADLALRLHHPNVVRTYEAGEDQGRPFLVMEYLDGQPLTRVVRRLNAQRVPPARAAPPLLSALCDALTGLDYAHELCDHDGTPLGVVHRDVTPNNVFLTYEGRAKLLDFGIAKVPHFAPATAAGSLKGTVRYMAPEQLRGAAVDRRVDVFAAGVILWEALAGQRLWAGLEDLSVLGRLMKRWVPSLREVAPATPAALVDVCARALSPDPDGRYPTARSLRDELAHELKALGWYLSPAERGALVADLFHDERERLRSITYRAQPLATSPAQDFSPSCGAMTLPAAKRAEAGDGPVGSPDTLPPFDPGQSVGAGGADPTLAPPGVQPAASRLGAIAVLAASIALGVALAPAVSRLGLAPATTGQSPPDLVATAADGARPINAQTSAGTTDVSVVPPTPEPRCLRAGSASEPPALTAPRRGAPVAERAPRRPSPRAPAASAQAPPPPASPARFAIPQLDVTSPYPPSP
jgi:eukaryotic-like serine/threonine-protein kinase